MIHASTMRSAERELLPLRVDARLTRLLGGHTGDLEIIGSMPGQPLRLRCELPRPSTTNVSLVVRVHSRAGIPLAEAVVDVKSGDSVLHTARLAILAMEGYSHLGAADRHAVEARVWSRRAFATASIQTRAEA